MNQKEEYRRICRELNMPLFASPFWLDLVCGNDKWDVVLTKKGDKVSGVLPYFFKRKGFIGMPPLTPYMGPIIFYPKDMKYSKRLSHEHQVLQELIERLPGFRFYNQRLHYSLQNWLAYYWDNYKQTTKYTYLLEDISNLEAVFAGFKSNVKRNIRKAEDQFSVRPLKSKEIRDYYAIIKKNRKPNYSEDFLYRLIKGCDEENCGKTFAAFDRNKQLFACVFIVWDKESAYYILGTRNSDVQTQQAMSLILWESIRYLSGRVKVFDFEGSMIEPIERYFRTYGSKQQSYFQITKNNSILFKLIFCFADIINKKIY
ncbi:MAG: GNAT family N-acetyltransferase [Bacteroidota bacterium]